MPASRWTLLGQQRLPGHRQPVAEHSPARVLASMQNRPIERLRVCGWAGYRVALARIVIVMVMARGPIRRRCC